MGELTHNRVAHLLRLIGGSGGCGEGGRGLEEGGGLIEDRGHGGLIRGRHCGGGVRVIGREAGGGLDRLVTGSYSRVLMLRFRLDGLGREGRSRNVLTGLEHMLTELKK